MVPLSAMERRSQGREQPVVQEDRRANVHNRKAGPVEHLLREVVQPLMV